MANDSYQLVVRNAPQSGLTPGQVIALEDEVLTLGRDPLSDIILDDPEVSRHHAKLLLQAGGYELQDMGSTNGTFVDGKRLGGEPLALKPGQVVMLGSNVTLVYQAIPAVDPMATVVAPAAAAAVEVEDVEDVLPVVEEIEEEVAEVDVEVPAPVVEASMLDEEAIDEPEPAIEEIVEEDEEEDFATMMDDSPLVAPIAEIPPEPEPFPDVPPVIEPLPELPPEPEPLLEEPVGVVESPYAEEPPAATFDELDDRTFIDSAAPVSDYVEPPTEPPALEVPPSSPPPLPEHDEPKAKDDSSRNRNIIIITAAIILLICCCLAILAGVLYFVPTFSA